MIGNELPARLRRSSHVSAFAHMGAVYLYHDLYGYILEMSPDVLSLLDAFARPASVSDVCAAHADRLSGASPADLVQVFAQWACLVAPDAVETDPTAELWDMVPVRARWTVWRRRDDRLTVHTAWGERPPARHELDRAETAIWDDIDGARIARELAAVHGADAVAALLLRLVHHDVQAIKLSPLPLSRYAGSPRLRPPYLDSTMPYPPYRPGAGPAGDADAGGADADARATGGAGSAAMGELSPREYYRRDVRDADIQFDHRETTLSHLLRRPHPALGGRTYGAALIDGLAARGWLPAVAGRALRVLEIGAGLGYATRAAIDALAARGVTTDYHIVELSPALAAAQRDRLGDAVTIHAGDVLDDALAGELPPGRFDLIWANEMIGDLPAVRLSHADAGIGLPAAERRARLDALGPAGALIAALDLPLDDAPDPFYVNTGALALLDRVRGWLAPGGACVLTEFGEPARYPRLSTHLDHPELSIHFGHLQHAAARLGLDAELAFVIDLIGLDRDLRGLATTRSYFRALAAMLAADGVTLDKIGYTEDMFAALVAGAIGPVGAGAPGSAVAGELHFDRIEDRLMGLVPHEFKALLVRHRPGAGERPAPPAT